MADNEQNSNDHPFHRERGDIIFDPPVDEKEAARERRESEQHEFARSQVRTNRTIAWFTGLLVLATFCTIAVGIRQAVIYHGQLGVMQGQLEEMKRSNDAAALAAYATCVSVQTARNSLINMGQNEEDTRRASIAAAYQAEASVSAQGAYVEPTFDHAKVVLGQAIRIPYSLQNSGIAAARNLTVTAEAVFIPKEPGPDFVYHRKQETVVQMGRFAGGSEYPARDPEGHASASIMVMANDGKPVYASQQDVDDFNGALKTVYVYLTLSYEDVFGKHWMKMCHYSDIILVDPALPIANVSHPKCDSYNQSDASRPLYAAPKSLTPPPNPPEIACKKPEDPAPN